MLGFENRTITSYESSDYNYNYAYNIFHEDIPDDRTCEHIVSKEVDHGN